MKKIEMLFYKTAPAKENTGLKFVLMEVIIPSGDKSESTITHDWGFALWMGDKWDDIPLPKTWTAKVVYWADTANPELLLKEPSRIIKI